MSSSSSSSNNKKKNQFLKSILFFKLGCNGGGSCGCGRPKLSDVLEPIPIPKTSSSSSSSSSSTLQNLNHPPNLLPNSSSSSFDNNNNRNDEDEEDEDYTCSTITATVDYDSLTIDDNHDHDHDPPGLVHEKCSASSAKLKDSIAVVKDSEDPLEDFKQSMKQMILEKQICSDEDLKALLNCFLELNSPFHHVVILRAFIEISDQIAVSGRRRRRRPSTSTSTSTSISQDDHKPSHDH